MSPSLSAWLKNTGLALAATASVGASWLAIASIAGQDALARFRVASDTTSPGIVMKNADFAVYDGARLLATAKASRMETSRDRTRVDLIKITDGKLYPEKGDPVLFTSEKASYEQFTRRVLGSAGVRLKGKDFDLTAPAFIYSEREQRLIADGKFQGKFQGGQVSATSLVYDGRGEKWTMKAVAWSGPIQDPRQPGQRRRWDFKADDMEVQGDTRIYLKARATDGEIIVRADRIEHKASTDVITATGNVRYWGEEANVSAPKLVVFRRESRLIASGRVNLLIKPEAEKGLKEEEIPALVPYVPDQIAETRPPAPAAGQSKPDEVIRTTKNIRDFPVTVIADQVEYWYREGGRRAEITGSPQARQEIGSDQWRMIWAHRAKYDGEGDWLTLLSRDGQKDARLKASNGDDFKALEFRISTKKDDDRWSAKKPEGVSYIDDDPNRPRTTGGGGSQPPPSLRGRIGGQRP